MHAYIGSNLPLFNLTLAAYLIGVGEGAYFGAGSQWADCDDWLLPHWEYDELLGPPDGPGALAGGVWSRSFGGGATRVALDTGAGGARQPCEPDRAGAWSIEGTQQFFALAASNATTRVYNVSCTTKCSTSWHTATAVMATPFTEVGITFNMQPGFKPFSDSGAFDKTCSIIAWRGGAWCAEAENPSCTPQAAKTSCIRWASGRTTGNNC